MTCEFCGYRQEYSCNSGPDAGGMREIPTLLRQTGKASLNKSASLGKEAKDFVSCYYDKYFNADCLQVHNVGLTGFFFVIFGMI